jgi:hypothetical protein
MSELPDAWIPVFDVLLDARVAWQTPVQIAAALGRSQEETLDLLCDLDVAGWLEVWEVDGGPRVTLSPLAAKRLSARLVEVGADGRTRWARAGEPEPPAPCATHVCADERAASLSYAEDPFPGVEAIADVAESHPLPPPPLGDDKETIPIHELPRPTIFVGLDLTPWPGPPTVQNAVCPVCGSRMLGPQMYCLYCDRWGLDHFLPVEKPKPPIAIPPDPRVSRLEREKRERLRKTAMKARLRAKRRQNEKDQAAVEHWVKKEDRKTAHLWPAQRPPIVPPTRAKVRSNPAALQHPAPGKSSRKAAR